MKEPLDHARALLGKAASDLIAADAIFATGEAMDMVCFHAQQAAEKSLKAALAARGLPFPWRHDLGELLHLVGPHLPAVLDLRASVIALSPFGVAGRYDEDISPAEDEARAAIELARKVNELVLRDL
jgi:HEPN domain-containing protein